MSGQYRSIAFTAARSRSILDLAGSPEKDGLVNTPDGVPWGMGAALRVCEGELCGVWLARYARPQPSFIPGTRGIPPTFECVGEGGLIDYMCPAS